MKTDSETILFTALGGIGEIGGNLYAYGYQDRWLLVDMGISFGDGSLPMIEVMMPDPTWIAEQKDKVVGLVLTHAHEDHLGAVSYLWDRVCCPVYATPFAAGLLETKLEEAAWGKQVPVHRVAMDAVLDLAPFTVRFVGMSHSIPEPCALAITTKAGTVVHSGDWKFDPSPALGSDADKAALKQLGDQGVLALVGDSTGAMTKGHSGSEAIVGPALERWIKPCRGKVAVACFATNVGRLRTIATIAARCNRHVVLVGRSLWRIESVARQLGYMDGIPPFLEDRDASHLPDDRVLYLSTGSQGEPRAALSRIAGSEHPQVKLGEGDMVIFSSRVIPGNERAILKVQNNLVRLGVTVVTDHDDREIHVSGHPYRDELKELYALLRPKIALPMHGEALHLRAHCDLARECGVPVVRMLTDGDLVALNGQTATAEIVDTVPVGSLGVDGPRLVRTDSEMLRNRRRLLFNGSAVCTLVVSRQGKLLQDPVITALGLLDAEHFAEEHDTAVAAARDAFTSLPAAERLKDEVAAEAVRVAVRRSLNAQVGRKAVTTVHLVRV